MSKLGYGLNVTKKPGGPPRPSAPRKSIFNDEDDFDDDGDESKADKAQDVSGTFEEESSKGRPVTGSDRAIKNGLGAKFGAKGPPSLYGSLAASHTTKKHAKAAEEIDPSIYDYDSFHNASSTARVKSSSNEVDRKPRYMSSLLAAADVRKRDQLRAKDVLLAKERAAEGDEFADREKFVTEAYKEQQAEAAKLEEEEKLREEEEAKRRGKGGGMVGFYKSVLEKDEKRHEDIVKAGQEMQLNDTINEQEGPDKSELDLAKEINAKGGHVQVNDDGQIVDKRQLLSAGLNVAPKPKGPSAQTAQNGSRPGMQQGGFTGGRVGDSRRLQRERQSRMLEEQLEEATKRAADEEADKQRELERTAKSRKTESDISSAKERYLARKRKAEEAKKRGKGD